VCPSNTMLLGPRPISLPSAILIHPAFGHNRYGPKIGGEGLCPFGEGELGPHLTQCGHGWGLPGCQVSSWSIQPFGHNTPTSTTAQTGQDRTDRQRSDSIEPTVLQTGAQKSLKVDLIWTTPCYCHEIPNYWSVPVTASAVVCPETGDDSGSEMKPTTVTVTTTPTVNILGCVTIVQHFDTECKN